MSSVFKAYVSLFVMLVFLTGITGLIIASLDSKRASDFMTAITTEISDTNFAQEVMEKCIQKADDMGYILSISKIDVDRDSHTDSAIATLNYHYTISLFDVDRVHTIRSVIR